MQEKSIQKNMIMSAILTMSNFVFPLITYGYVARVLTAAGTGKVAFVSSILSYFVFFAGLGVHAYGRREAAKVRNDKHALSKLTHELMAINGITVGISYIVLFILLQVVPTFQEYKPLFRVMAVHILLAPMGVEWFYEGLEEYSYITKRSILFKLVSVVLTFVLIRSREDVLWYGFLTVFTTCASKVCNLWNLHRYIYRSYLGDYDLKRHIKPVIVLFAASAAITIYASFDITMLGFISTETEVGLYNASVKVERIIQGLSTAIVAVLIPRMANYFGTQQWDKIREMTARTIRLTLLLAVPVCVYVMVFSESVMGFVAGPEFVSMGNVQRIKMLCVIMSSFTYVFGSQLLIPIGKEKRYTQSITVGLLINLIMNSLLIPGMGAIGAALGTLLTELWNVIFMGLGAREYLPGNLKVSRYLIPLIFSAAAAYAIGIMVTAFHVFWQLAATALVFFAIYYGWMYLIKEPLLFTIVDKVLEKLGLAKHNR